MRLSRRLRRLALIPRARRVRVEREFLELDEFLEAIRASSKNKPPWERRVYADEVE